MPILGSDTQLDVGVHHRIDIILHLVVVIVVVVERALIGAVAVLVDKDDAVSERVILGTRGGIVGLGIGMEVLGTAYLGRSLAEPSTISQLTGINLDEVDVVELSGIAVLVNRPINHEARLQVVGQIIGIPLAKERLEPVVAIAVAHVDGAVGQPGATEGEHRVLDPQWPIGLVVESVTPHIAAGGHGVIAGPVDVGCVVDKTPGRMRCTGLALIGLVVSHLKVLLAAFIVRALDFIPFISIARHSVAIGIHAHHDDAGLTTATRQVGDSIALDGVAVNLHVIAVLVDDRMVEAKHDVATIAAQADRSVQATAQGRLDLGEDAVLGETWLIGREEVDKLARGGQVVIHMGDIGRVAGGSRQCCHHNCYSCK